LPKCYNKDKNKGGKMAIKNDGSSQGENFEQFKVSGAELKSKIENIIKEGNARKIIVKNEADQVIAEFPLTVGAIGVVLAPVLAAVGALAALVTNCTIIVEKR
jgi:hypothetical protein